MTNFVLNKTQRQFLKLTPLNALGEPSQIEAGSLRIELVSGPQGTIEKIDDGMVYFRGDGDRGGLTAIDSVYSVIGDADLGEGVVEITHQVTVTNVVEPAVGFGVETGPVETVPTV